MLLRQLNYYQAVVRLNSFTAAAAECRVSQSAISQQIQALEQSLGIPLLQRSGRRFTPTPAGEFFYRKSLILTADLERMVEETLLLAHNGHAGLRIGYLNSWHSSALQLAVAEFSKLHPDTPIHTIQGTHAELFHKLQANAMDVILTDQCQPCSDLYVSVLLTVSGCCAEISSRSPIAQLDSVTTEELKNTPCILVAAPEQQEAEQAYYRNITGFSGNFLFAEYLEEARLMVAGNQGFLPVQENTPLAQSQSTIRRLPLFQKGNQVRRSLCAVWQTDCPVSYVKEFVKILKEAFSSPAPSQK